MRTREPLLIESRYVESFVSTPRMETRKNRRLYWIASASVSMEGCQRDSVSEEHSRPKSASPPSWPAVFPGLVHPDASRKRIRAADDRRPAGFGSRGASGYFMRCNQYRAALENPPLSPTFSTRHFPPALPALNATGKILCEKYTPLVNGSLGERQKVGGRAIE